MPQLLQKNYPPEVAEKFHFEAAVQIGSYCYRFTLAEVGQPDQVITPPPVTTNLLLTSAKVVFIASCDTASIFQGWWNMNLNAAPGGRALVVPDLAAMASLPVNQSVAPQSIGTVDLVEGTLAYQAFVNSLASHHSVQKAVGYANQAIAKAYSPNNYAGVPQLPQVVYKVVGNGSLCLTPACKE